MTMKTRDLIAFTPQRATTADALNGLERIVEVTNQDHAFALALMEACEQGGLDFSVAYSHCANETDYYRDPDFTEDNNPAGIGHPDGAAQGLKFDTVRAGARFYVGEMLLKLRKPIPPALSDARSYAPAKWDQVERLVGGSHGPFPIVRVIDDLNERFGPNDNECVWMCDALGPQAIVGKSVKLFPALPDQGEATMPPTTKPKILVDAGHRSTDRTGNPAETDLTDDMARAYVDEFRRRGFDASWLQRDVDMDADPDDTVGNLDTVGRTMRRWMEQTPGDLLMLSCHYNGAHSPLHAIVPDNRNLSTAVAGGDPGDDTAANNVLDCKVGETIVQLMASRGLGGLFHGKLNRPGLMSETETGVGLDGFRLAVMAYTAPHRARAVRLVVEHGGTADPAAQRFADFARCAADAVETVYGKTTPSTTTTAPPITYPPKPIDAPDFISAQGHELIVNDPRRFRCIQGQTLRTAPSLEAPAATKTPAKAGRVYTFDYSATVEGTVWLVSKHGSWALARGFEEAA